MLASVFPWIETHQQKFDIYSVLSQLSRRDNMHWCTKLFLENLKKYSDAVFSSSIKIGGRVSPLGWLRVQLFFGKCKRVPMISQWEVSRTIGTEVRGERGKADEIFRQHCNNKLLLYSNVVHAHWYRFAKRARCRWLAWRLCWGTFWRGGAMKFDASKTCKFGFTSQSKCYSNISESTEFSERGD